MGKRFTRTDASASLRDLDVTGDGLPCRGITATDQCACDQTRNHKQMFLIVGHLATPFSDAAFPSAALRSS